MPSAADAANEAAWRDARNWRWPGIYVARADSRVLVPKQPWDFAGRQWFLGWTINFAKPESGPLLVALVAAPLVLLQLVRPRTTKWP